MSQQRPEQGLWSWNDPVVRWSVGWLCVLSVAAVLAGFLWLPSAQGDYSAQGLWASICRAAGVPGRWSDAQGPAPTEKRSTSVVLTQAMAGRGSDAAVGRGATLALQCTMCHGARGLSEANAPNLAGQYPAVLIKQLIDYQHGDRASAVMQALAGSLSEPDIRDLAAYYAYLPKPARGALQLDAAAPALVRVGDPMRNIAPCASCHGGIDNKLGAPWLEGMPKEYLAVQLKNFATGLRRNDSHGQMRNMARSLTALEIEALAGFYARAESAEGR